VVADGIEELLQRVGTLIGLQSRAKAVAVDRGRVVLDLVHVELAQPRVERALLDAIVVHHVLVLEVQIAHELADAFLRLEVAGQRSQLDEYEHKACA
jgi:hypothetical protein